MSNRLLSETSPYLLQHSENPVDWYPWCDEAFEKARIEDKPVFLSIGYSSCHWCHVMAHESFEDAAVADFLNNNFISVKVDREERPDIDSVYISVCQAFTGSGGWPASIFMTSEKKPFFAGTYFPKNSLYGMTGFIELLNSIADKWKNDRKSLLDSADNVTDILKSVKRSETEADVDLIGEAVMQFTVSFDEKHGGFGNAPKFPTPHNLIFLMTQYEKIGDKKCLEMAEKTLRQLYFGGIFDHIGGGFCRYSTDRYFLVPHFEKMLYDNALLIMAYAKAFSLTDNSLYKSVAIRTAEYIFREMTSDGGGFFSAQDADSGGEEGSYYTFTPSEINDVLGKAAGESFNQCYNITKYGNFDGKSIPNLLFSENTSDEFETAKEKIYDYRKKRSSLMRDEKILTSRNSLMIAAMCSLYRITQDGKYLNAATKAMRFIEENLFENGVLFVGITDGKRSGKGYSDDYADYIFALLSLYGVTLEKEYLDKAKSFTERVIENFWDKNDGGFFLYGSEHEKLILRPKESYDGAIPSGNSMMAYNLVRLNILSSDEKYSEILSKQLDFMSKEAVSYPTGYAMFLTALSDYNDPPEKIVAVSPGEEEINELIFSVPGSYIVKVLTEPTEEYPLKDGGATYYVCKNRLCLPPVNSIDNI